MGKISLYPIVAGVATLDDMVIGTDVSNINQTENFELSQILALYPQLTQKISLYSSSNQTATVINTANVLNFNVKEFSTTGLVGLPTVSLPYTSVQIGNTGYYLIQCELTTVSTGSGAEISAWLNVNGTNVGTTHVKTLMGVGNDTLTMNWVYSFNAADAIAIKWQTTNLNASLGTVVAGSRPIVPSAKLIITQV